MQISPNIIFTNYKRFILFSFEKVVFDIDLLDDKLDLKEENISIFRNLLKAYFDDNSTTIKSKQELVKVLSTQSFYLSNALKFLLMKVMQILLLKDFSKNKRYL